MANREPVYYMAPMLGITDACFRTAYTRIFGGFDLGISPFIRTLQGQRFKKNGVVDLLPSKNTDLPVIPQILTNQTDDFIHLANVLFDMGYPTLNLNMGCPVHSASGRRCGAGLLKEIDHVDAMLERVLTAVPCRLSVKTRIGYDSETDLLKMAAVLNRYPLEEVIIHPRTAQQKYQGDVNHDAFAAACAVLQHEIVYSGDIRSPEDLTNVQARHPHIHKWMIGRGILYDPYLMVKARRRPIPPPSAVGDFYQLLTELYRRRDLADPIIATRLKTFVAYLGVGMNFSKDVVKMLRKAKRPDDMLACIHDVTSAQVLS